MTDFRYFTLADAHLAEGVVVVIDVLRAFTTAAYALAKGACKIYPVGTIEEALMLKAEIPGSLIMGEVDGFKPGSFDFSNSPAEIFQQELQGCTLIQRTSAGTQGVIRTIQADHQFVASFVVAKATAMKIQELAPDLVSFIVTGESMGRDGDEDLASGEYIEELVKGHQPNPEDYVNRIETSTIGRSFLKGKTPYLSQHDIAFSKWVDYFDFFLPVHQEGILPVIEKGLVE
jgi:2-phosphosulfolactate phosphatase